MMRKIVLFLIAAIFSMGISVQAEDVGACVIVDGTPSGINVERPFPMYSVMKFPQALYVADFLVKHGIDADEKVTVKRADLMQDTWSPMLTMFGDERAFSYAELLALTLQQSDNNACDILFRVCGSPRKVERYIRRLGFKDIHIRKTERQMHDRPQTSAANWCTPVAMAELLRWFHLHRDDHRLLRLVWQLMASCETGKDRIPVVLPTGSTIVHKTGTGFPTSQSMPSGMCDVGIILSPDARPLPIAVFVTNPSSPSRVAEIAHSLLNE